MGQKSKLNEILNGHIKIDPLHIDYKLPEELGSYHRWRNRLYIWVGASVIGVLATAFAYLCDAAGERFGQIRGHHFYLSLVLTPIGMVILTWLTDRFFSSSSGSGIPQVIAALNSQDRQLKGRLLSTKALVAKIILTPLGLLIGGSLGREGPTVQIGSTIMKIFGSRLRQPYAYTSNSMILAGGAAGVAAAFNTPIAGIVFAIEELSRAFIAKDTNILLMTVVIAGLAALSINGHYFYFGQHSSALTGVENLYAILIGIGGGLLGGLFTSLILDGRLVVRRFKGRNRYLFMLGLGVLISLLGLMSDGTSYGTGYEQARLILEGQTMTPTFTLAKFFATIATYLTGIPGGIFSPSLSIGAGLGRLFADVFPTVPFVAFVLLGMVSYFSGVIRAPITAIVIVAEMSNDHLMLFPLMLAAVSASATSQLVCNQPFYATLAEDFLIPKTSSTEKNYSQ